MAARAARGERRGGQAQRARRASEVDARGLVQRSTARRVRAASPYAFSVGPKAKALTVVDDHARGLGTRATRRRAHVVDDGVFRVPWRRPNDGLHAVNVYAGETGEGLADNPLASSDDPNARRIVAYGMRNPFRFAPGVGDHELWVGEVGLGGPRPWQELAVPDLLEQAPVGALRGQQLVVGPLLDDPAALQDDDPPGLLHDVESPLLPGRACHVHRAFEAARHLLERELRLLRPLLLRRRLRRGVRARRGLGARDPSGVSRWKVAQGRSISNAQRALRAKKHYSHVSIFDR